jgi:hypothetical protein
MYGWRHAAHGFIASRSRSIRSVRVQRKGGFPPKTLESGGNSNAPKALLIHVARLIVER